MIRPMPDVKVDWLGWVHDLQHRAAIESCVKNIFDDQVYTAVKHYQSLINLKTKLDIERIQALRDQHDDQDEACAKKNNELVESIQPGSKLRDKEIKNTTGITEKLYKSAQQALRLDQRAWACVQKGLKGSNLIIIAGKTAREAFLEVEKMHGNTSQHRRIALGRQLMELRITDLSPEGVKEFLDERFILISQLQTLEPNSTLYSWESQRIQLAFVLPVDFGAERSAHYRKSGLELTYASLVQDIKDTIQFPYYIEKYGRSRKLRSCGL